MMLNWHLALILLFVLVSFSLFIRGAHSSGNSSEQVNSRGKNTTLRTSWEFKVEQSNIFIYLYSTVSGSVGKNIVYHARGLSSSPD